MTEKELKRLRRSELLELLLIQTRETERLQKKLEQAERELADRNLRIEKAGNIAQAALEINGVMEAAQAAAQQYLDSIARMEQQTARRCEAILQQSRKEAARRIREAARSQADQSLIGEIHSPLDENIK